MKTICKKHFMIMNKQRFCLTEFKSGIIRHYQAYFNNKILLNNINDLRLKEKRIRKKILESKRYF